MSISFTGLTPIQLKVIQVAIDHMEEHLADVASTGLDGLTQQTRADVSASAVEDLEEKVQVLQRLIAAKQIKAELKWAQTKSEVRGVKS